MKINSIIDLVKDLDTSRQTKNLNKLLIRILLHLQVEFSTYKCKIEVEIEVNERSGAANYFCYETEEVEYQVRFVASRVLS